MKIKVLHQTHFETLASEANNTRIKAVDTEDFTLLNFLPWFSFSFFFSFQ